jgi:hypothetical protein
LLPSIITCLAFATKYSRVILSFLFSPYQNLPKADLAAAHVRVDVDFDLSLLDGSSRRFTGFATQSDAYALPSPEFGDFAEQRPTNDDTVDVRVSATMGASTFIFLSRAHVLSLCCTVVHCQHVITNHLFSHTLLVTCFNSVGADRLFRDRRRHGRAARR